MTAKKFGRGVYLKERGHYECKIWESMSKQRTLTAKFDRGVDLQGREDIMTRKVWKSGDSKWAERICAKFRKLCQSREGERAL